MSENFTYPEILNDTIETVKWLKSLKINIDNSRIPGILKYTELFVNEYPKHLKGEKTDVVKYANECGTAINEGSALNLIRKSFLNSKSKKLKDNIKASILGSFHSIDEDGLNNTNHARNILFELETAAYLKYNDYDVTFEFEDVNYNVNNYKISIQCKRLITLGNVENPVSNLERHLIKAVSQLIDKNGIIQDPNSYGFIALSLEKLYKLDEGIMPVKDTNELDNLMDDTIHDLFIKIDPILYNILQKYEGQDLKLLGLMYLYKRPIYYLDNKQFSLLRRYFYQYPKFPENTSHREITDYIDNKRN